MATALRLIADRIPRLRAQGNRISEQDTKRILITPAVEALGWDILDIDEVRNEYRHKAADNRVDYALFLSRSPARVLDGRHVEFQGRRMTFNEWGQRITGWPPIRIYTMACLPDGRTLDTLRDQAEGSRAKP